MACSSDVYAWCSHALQSSRLPRMPLKSWLEWQKTPHRPSGIPVKGGGEADLRREGEGTARALT